MRDVSLEHAVCVASLSSYGYSVFFAVNHWTNESKFADNSSVANTNWGVLQVENSANFAMKSKFWTFLSGGLNY